MAASLSKKEIIVKGGVISDTPFYPDVAGSFLALVVEQSKKVPIEHWAGEEWKTVSLRVERKHTPPKP